MIIFAIFINVFLKPQKKKKQYKKKNNFVRQKNNYTDMDFYKSLKKKKNTLTRKEKKIKGDLYEKYVSKYYQNLGYTVWEHGIEKGYKDQGIDLFLKKENQYLFIQCKNWKDWKITDTLIKKYRLKARNYMKNNPKISRIILDFNYEIKLVMITPKDCYTQKAKKYLKENSHIIEYKIIPMN